MDTNYATAELIDYCRHTGLLPWASMRETFNDLDQTPSHLAEQIGVLRFSAQLDAAPRDLMRYAEHLIEAGERFAEHAADRAFLAFLAAAVQAVAFERVEADMASMRRCMAASWEAA